MGTIGGEAGDELQGASMALAIAAMLVVEWLVTNEFLLPPLLIFASVALVSVVIAIRRWGRATGSERDPLLSVV